MVVYKVFIIGHLVRSWMSTHAPLCYSKIFPAIIWLFQASHKIVSRYIQVERKIPTLRNRHASKMRTRCMLTTHLHRWRIELWTRCGRMIFIKRWFFIAGRPLLIAIIVMWDGSNFAAAIIIFLVAGMAATTTAVAALTMALIHRWWAGALIETMIVSRRRRWRWCGRIHFAVINWVSVEVSMAIAVMLTEDAMSTARHLISMSVGMRLTWSKRNAGQWQKYGVITGEALFFHIAVVGMQQVHVPLTHYC